MGSPPRTVAEEQPCRGLLEAARGEEDTTPPFTTVRLSALRERMNESRKISSELDALSRCFADDSLHHASLLVEEGTYALNTIRPMLKRNAKLRARLASVLNELSSLTSAAVRARAKSAAAEPEAENDETPED